MNLYLIICYWCVCVCVRACVYVCVFEIPVPTQRNNMVLFIIVLQSWIVGSTTKATKTTDTAKLTTTTRSVTSSRGSSPVATVKVNSTAPPSDRDVKKVEVVLTQAAPSLGSSDQSTIDRMIDSIIDNNVLSLNDIAQFLLSPPHERSVILMQAVNKVNEKSGKLHLYVYTRTVSLLLYDLHVYVYSCSKHSGSTTSSWRGAYYHWNGRQAEAFRCACIVLLRIVMCCQ